MGALFLSKGSNLYHDIYKYSTKGKSYFDETWQVLDNSGTIQMSGLSFASQKRRDARSQFQQFLKIAAIGKLRVYNLSHTEWSSFKLL